MKAVDLSVRIGPLLLRIREELGATVLILSCLSWAFNYVRQGYSATAVGDVVLAIRKDAFGAVTVVTGLIGTALGGFLADYWKGEDRIRVWLRVCAW